MTCGAPVQTMTASPRNLTGLLPQDQPLRCYEKYARMDGGGQGAGKLRPGFTSLPPGVRNIFP